MIERLRKDAKYGKVSVSSLDVDSVDYYVLEEAVHAITNVQGMTLEIGTRAGGSSKVIIDSIMKSNPRGIRTHICIDPYGGIDYRSRENEIIEDAYPDKLRDIAIPALFRYCVNSKVNFQFYQMTDEQFMKRFDDGVPVYVSGREKILNTYALVFFDGPHHIEAVMAEARFFCPRALKGAVYVFDDVEGYYDHSIVDKYMKDNGWALKRITSFKASYVKL